MLPCKVGDTVWTIDPIGRTIQKVSNKVEDIHVWIENGAIDGFADTAYISRC